VVRPRAARARGHAGESGRQSPERLLARIAPRQSPADANVALVREVCAIDRAVLKGGDELIILHPNRIIRYGCMLATIERAAHLIGAYVEQAADELGITQAEAHVLAQLARHGPTTIGTLHDNFGRKRSTLTNILDRLEQRGFVRRELNSEDRRSFVIHLTGAGRRAATRVAKVLDELEREVGEIVSERDLRGLDAVAGALGTVLGSRRGAPA
jgi:DNA-binding MarR family transcriptional regulator